MKKLPKLFKLLKLHPVMMVILVMLTIWSAGFLAFSSYVNKLSSGNRSSTDAIVVFGGSKQRLYAGVQLLRLGYAPLVFITGNKPKEAYYNFFKVQKLAPEQFIFDTKLANNNSNHAADTYLFLRKYQLHSIRIVVDAEQMPRALLELQNKIPPEVVIVPNPVSKKNSSYKRIVREYFKYQLVIVASFLGLEDKLDFPY